MRVKIAICIVLLLCNFAVIGQPQTLRPYIEAWKKTGKDQSYASQVFFDSLRITKEDSVWKKHYWDIIHQLRQYIGNHPDRRLEVRLMMFEIMAAREHNLEAQYHHLVDEAIKKAHALEDPQLNAELYSIRAEFPYSPETHLLYNLKAVEIQRKIGFLYFPYVINRFFGISADLYEQGNYKQCIAYGKAGLAAWNLDSNHRDPRVFIFQCDLIGASYRNLNIQDSCRWYYEKILDALKDEKEERVIKLWQGIAYGNIGRSYTQEGKYHLVAPLLNTYLQNSMEVADSLNIVMSLNALATFHYQQNRYAPAIPLAREALAIAGRHQMHSEIVTAAHTMAEVFRHYNSTDSALYYYKLAEVHKDAVRERIKKSEFSNIRAQLSFENLQHSFVLAKAEANRERSLRNAILSVIVLLTIIALLLYNKKRLKEQAKLKEMQLKHMQSEKQITDAREKIALFTTHLIEKNNLIDSLTAQLNKSTTEVAEQLLTAPLLTEADWEKFRLEFSKAYPFFLAHLHSQSPSITPAMERLASLIFLKLTNYQIANSLGISKDSVARSKRRLKLVLNLSSEQILEDYICSIGSSGI